MSIVNELESEIRQRLAALSPVTLELDDESARHAGHAGNKGGGGYFRLNISSHLFAGLRTMERHRLVYDALSPLLADGRIHALSITTHLPTS